jgi:hypothetical protein
MREGKSREKCRSHTTDIIYTATMYQCGISFSIIHVDMTPLSMS